MARSPGRDTLTSLQYRSPLTGGPALATLGCLLQGLPAGARTRPRRETASSVIVVARGTGTLTCGGQPPRCRRTTWPPSRPGPGIS